MEIREAKYLLEIERAGNLTRAAVNLFITQPALSKSLKKLEGEFGGELFMRENSRTVPTDLGTIVIAHARNIVEEYTRMEGAVDDFKRRSGKRVRIAFSTSGNFLVADAIDSFCLAHPDIELVSSIMGGIEMMEAFGRHEIDVSLLLPKGADKEGILNEDSIFDMPVGVAVTNTHPWAERECVECADFENQVYVTWDKTTYFYHAFNEHLAANGVTSAVPRMLSREMSWLVHYAELTSTPMVLPVPVLEQTCTPQMTIMPLAPKMDWELSLAYPKGGRLSESTITFIRHIIDFFRAKKLEATGRERQPGELDYAHILSF